MTDRPGDLPLMMTDVEKIAVQKQRAEDDCTLCAIAMAAGLPYERVLAVARSVENGYVPGKGTASTKAVLRALGIEGQRAYRKSIASADFFRLLWGRKAIVELPSLNDWGGHHDVFWDGYQIVDPSNKKTYPASPEGLEPWVVTLVPDRALAALTPQDRKSTIERAGLRERVARLVDPPIFKLADHMWEHCRRSGDSPEFTFRCVVDSYGDRVALAYDRADAILAMLPGGGWGEQDYGSSRASRDAGQEPAPVSSTPLEWRPIDSAPLDTHLLVYGEKIRWRGPTIGFRHSDYNGHKGIVTLDGRCGAPSRDVTHWLPLPPLPAENDDDGSAEGVAALSEGEAEAPGGHK